METDQILKIIKKNNINPLSICEVGCGAGEILNQLYLKMPDNINFFGYEISPQAFKLCELRKKERLSYFLKDILDDNDVYFNILLLIDVIEHIENCFSFLRNIKNKAEFKIFNIPLELWFKSLIPNELLKSRLEFGHIHYFNKELGLQVLREQDYKVIDYILTPAFENVNIYSPKIVRLLKYPRKALYAIDKDISSRILGGSSLLVLTK